MPSSPAGAAPACVAGITLEQPQGLWRLDCACRRQPRPVWQLGDTALVLDPVVATNDLPQLPHLTLGGGLATELPPILAPAPLAQGQLVEVLPEYRLPRQTVRALSADTLLQSPLVRHFLEFMAEAVRPTLDPYVGG